MELQTVSKQIHTIETVFDDFDERPVDCDFVLPDYLPDIAAVLKCILKPVVQTHQVSGDRVMADGTVTLQVLYLDEERKCVRSFEMSQPFTSAFTVSNMDGADRVMLSAKVNYVNCRAASPRRVDIHGAFSVRLMVQSSAGHAVIESVQNDELCVKDHEVAYSVPVAMAEKVFTLNEMLELDNDTAEMLLRTEATAQIEDCKQMAGKAIVKGEILLKSVYAADTVMGTMGTCEHRIPFSQIVDADGLSEEDMCSCTASLLLCEVHPTHNPNGESKLLSFTAKLCLSLQAYRTENCRLITDAYHTRFPLKTACKRLLPCRISHISDDVVTVRQKVELPDTDITAIEDVWCDGLTTACTCAEDGSAVEGHLLAGMIARDSHGCLAYYERPVDFRLAFDELCTRMTAEVCVIKTQCNLSGTQLELQLTLAVKRTCFVAEDHLAITEMTADEAAPHTQSDAMRGCCLKAYFAGAGESVWDIAKAQHTPIDELRAENHLEGDILPEDTMLLILLK